MKAIHLAAALSLFGFALAAAPASAAPVAPVSIQAAQPVLLQVQYSHRDRPEGRDRRDDRRGPPRYVPGHRYKSAPHGWHRYDRRPRDWNRRGCVMVGPLWFCQ